MSMWPYRSFEANGADWTTLIDDDGEFTATLEGADGVTVRADTFVKLVQKAKLLASKRRVRISVPVTVASRAQNGGLVLRNGVIYGINAGSGNYMTEWADGSKGQLDVAFKDVYPQLSDMEIRRMTDLSVAVRQAMQAHEAFRREVKGEWDVKRAVDAAMREASGADKGERSGRPRSGLLCVRGGPGRGRVNGGHRRPPDSGSGVPRQAREGR